MKFENCGGNIAAWETGCDAIILRLLWDFTRFDYETSYCLVNIAPFRWWWIRTSPMTYNLHDIYSRYNLSSSTDDHLSTKFQILFMALSRAVYVMKYEKRQYISSWCVVLANNNTIKYWKMLFDELSHTKRNINNYGYIVLYHFRWCLNGYSVCCKTWLSQGPHLKYP